MIKIIYTKESQLDRNKCTKTVAGRKRGEEKIKKKSSKLRNMCCPYGKGKQRLRG